jgi:hypothetical protein
MVTGALRDGQIEVMMNSGGMGVANESRVTDDAWREARRKWECGEASVQKIADSLGVSKALVMKKKAAEGWQLAIGVAPVPVGGAAQANAKVTESAGASQTRTGSVTGHPGAESPRALPPDAVVSEVVVARPAAAPAPSHMDEIRVPDHLDDDEREEFVKRAIVGRQKAIHARQAKELSAVRSQLYAAIKGATSKGGSTVAMAVKNSIMALASLHEQEEAAELKRVRLEFDEFAGKSVRQTPCRIVVHMREGAKIGE